MGAQVKGGRAQQGARSETSRQKKKQKKPNTTGSNSPGVNYTLSQGKENKPKRSKTNPTKYRKQGVKGKGK